MPSHKNCQVVPPSWTVGDNDDDDDQDVDNYDDDDDDGDDAPYCNVLPPIVKLSPQIGLVFFDDDDNNDDALLSCELKPSVNLYPPVGLVAGRGCSTKEKMYYVHCEAHEMDELEEKFCYCSFNYCNTATASKKVRVENMYRGKSRYILIYKSKLYLPWGPIGSTWYLSL